VKSPFPFPISSLVSLSPPQSAPSVPIDHLHSNHTHNPSNSHHAAKSATPAPCVSKVRPRPRSFGSLPPRGFFPMLPSAVSSSSPAAPHHPPNLPSASLLRNAARALCRTQGVYSVQRRRWRRRRGVPSSLL
jgi:hypothetical protein